MRYQWEGIINVGGIDLYVLRLGEGPELITIHGGPDWDHTYLKAFMSPQADARTLLFFDIRGCGRSQRFEDCASLHIRHVVEDIRNLMIYFELERADVLGFSFGGRIALEFLSQYPAYVGKLILASSSAYSQSSSGKAPPLMTPDEVRVWALKNIERDVQTQEGRRLAQRAIANVRFSNQWLQAIHSGLPIGYPERDYSPILRKLAVPTLVLHGELDRTFPVTAARKLVQEVPSATMTEIPYAGHMAQMDAPRRWNKSIEDFLRSG